MPLATAGANDLVRTVRAGKNVTAKFHSRTKLRKFLSCRPLEVVHSPAAIKPACPMHEPATSEILMQQRRRRAELWGLLGDLPPGHAPTLIRQIRRERTDSYELQHLELGLNGVEPVPAVLLVPHLRKDRAPALLYMHSHGGNYEQGKEELWQGCDVMPAYAPLLAQKGIVTLAIDSWCFSDRKHAQDGARGERDLFKLMLWRGQVLWGIMLFDELQALNYLCSLPIIDPARVAVFGLSMGATKAWWLAALDDRVRLCIDLCCLTDYDELIRTEHLEGHGLYYYVPRLLPHFSSAQINELIAPRPRLSLNGRYDPLTPAAGVERIRERVLPAYEQFGCPECCRIELFDCGHEETPVMRNLVSEWLDRYLVDT